MLRKRAANVAAALHLKTTRLVDDVMLTIKSPGQPPTHKRCVYCQSKLVASIAGIIMKFGRCWLVADLGERRGTIESQQRHHCDQQLQLKRQRGIGMQVCRFTTDDARCQLVCRQHPVSDTRINFSPLLEVSHHLNNDARNSWNVDKLSYSYTMCTAQDHRGPDCEDYYLLDLSDLQNFNRDNSGGAPPVIHYVFRHVDGSMVPEVILTKVEGTINAQVTVTFTVTVRHQTVEPVQVRFISPSASSPTSCAHIQASQPYRGARRHADAMSLP